MNLKLIPTGKKAPDEVNVVIEIPQGSSIKYEIDKESGALFVDRFIHTAMSYPFNYGFVPGTLADDGDPIDVLVISEQAVIPGSVIAVRPIGMLEMEDEAGMDEKILAVPVAKVDPTFAHVKEASDIPAHTHEKIKHFFAHYKELEGGKWVKVKNILGRKEALAAIQKSMEAAK